MIEHALDLTEDQKAMEAIIKHHYVLQDQFNQLTQHCENLYTRLAEIEKLVHARVLS